MMVSNPAILIFQIIGKKQLNQQRAPKNATPCKMFGKTPMELHSKVLIPKVPQVWILKAEPNSSPTWQPKLPTSMRSRQSGLGTCARGVISRPPRRRHRMPPLYATGTSEETKQPKWSRKTSSLPLGHKRGGTRRRHRGGLATTPRAQAKRPP